jgi:hypothetical protein
VDEGTVKQQKARTNSLYVFIGASMNTLFHR